MLNSKHFSGAGLRPAKCICGCTRWLVSMNLCTVVIMKQVISEKQHMCSAELPWVNKVNTYTQWELGGNGCRPPQCCESARNLVPGVWVLWPQHESSDYSTCLSDLIPEQCNTWRETEDRTFYTKAECVCQATTERHLNGLFEETNDGWLKVEGGATCSSVSHSQDPWIEPR